MATTLLCEIILSWKDHEIPVDTILLLLLFLWQYFYDTTHYCSHRTVKLKQFKTDAFCLQEIQDSRQVKYYQAFDCCTTNRMKIFMFCTQVDPKRTAALSHLSDFQARPCRQNFIIFQRQHCTWICWTKKSEELTPIILCPIK